MNAKFCAIAVFDSIDSFELDCAKTEETHKRHTILGAKRSRFICQTRDCLDVFKVAPDGQVPARIRYLPRPDPDTNGTRGAIAVRMCIAVSVRRGKTVRFVPACSDCAAVRTKK